jgi:Ni/Co efflux regulator RcnB
MRKFILSILLASAATSASAVPPTSDSESDRPKAERQEAREQRQAAREESRQQRSDGARDFGQARQQEQPRVQAQPQVEARRQQWQGGNFEGRRQEQVQQQQQQWQRRGGFEQHNNVRANVTPPQAPEQQRSTWTGTRDGSRWTGDRSTWTGNRDARSGTWSGSGLRQGERPTPNVMRDRNATIVNQAQRTDGHRWSGRSGGTWNRDWRNDRRYDWRRYRDSHRSIFHIGIYYDPFGYNSYRPFNIGYRLYPSYYGQQYWIDPGMYQLPYPPPGTVWVRYWDDALLVDTYSGEVVDVIRNFFW